MSDCCSTNTAKKEKSACCSNQPAPKKHTCPADSKQYTQVSYTTVLHHIKQPWKQLIKEQTYYFCNSPECDVVYFGLDNTLIKKEQLRTKVGVKSPDDEDALVCYCFDVLMTQAKNNTGIKAFVTEQTKNGTCSCAIFNPSGKCCLKDFPK